MKFLQDFIGFMVKKDGEIEDKERMQSAVNVSQSSPIAHMSPDSKPSLHPIDLMQVGKSIELLNLTEKAEFKNILRGEFEKWVKI